MKLAILSATCMLSVSVAQACSLDSVPSVSLNGHLAALNKQIAQTPAQLALWAPFVFRQRPHAGQVVHFSENRKEVARSLTKQAMSHAALWRFGDGKSALGWTVSHSFKHSGQYRITVFAFDGHGHRWYPFDRVTISILPVRTK